MCLHRNPRSLNRAIRLDLPDAQTPTTPTKGCQDKSGIIVESGIVMKKVAQFFWTPQYA